MIAGTEDRLYTRQFWILFSAHLLFCIHMSSLSLLSLYVKELGGDEATMGSVSAIGMLGGLLLRPFWGAFLDGYGRRWAFITGGVTMPAAFFCHSLMSEVHFWFFANCFVQGIALGGTFATFFTYINDICPERRVAEGVAMFGISGLIGMAVGPGLAEWLLHRYGFVSLFRVLSCCAFIPLSMCLMLPETIVAGGPRRLCLRQFYKVVRKPQLFPLWMVLLAFGCALASQRTFLAPLIERHGIGSVSYFFSSYAIASALLRLVAADLPDRLGRVFVLLPAVVFYALAHLILGTVPSTTGMILAGVCGGVGHGFMFPILNTLVNEYAGSAHRGMATSCFVMALDLGGISGNIVFGRVATYAGFSGVFILVSALLFGVSLLVWNLQRHN